MTSVDTPRRMNASEVCTAVNVAGPVVQRHQFGCRIGVPPGPLAAVPGSQQPGSGFSHRATSTSSRNTVTPAVLSGFVVVPQNPDIAAETTRSPAGIENVWVPTATGGCGNPLSNGAPLNSGKVTTIVAAAATLAANVATTPTLDLTTLKTRICAFHPEIPRFRIILIAIQSNCRGHRQRDVMATSFLFVTHFGPKPELCRHPATTERRQIATNDTFVHKCPFARRRPVCRRRRVAAQLRRAQPQSMRAHRTTSWPRSAPQVPPARLSCWSTRQGSSPTIRWAIRMSASLRSGCPPNTTTARARAAAGAFPCSTTWSGSPGRVSPTSAGNLSATTCRNVSRASFTRSAWGRRSWCSPTASPRSAATSTSIRRQSGATPIT